MLDRLPSELLHQVLVLTYPPSPWPDKDDKDKERRQSLTKLSLVCKVISAVAQHLWRKLSVVSEDELDFTRRLQKLETPLKAKVQTCPEVKKLQCTNGWTTWEQLSGFSSLRTIELFSLEIWPEPSPNPLSLQPFNLVHLSLLAVSVFQQDDFDRLLQPNILPNLSTLWVEQLDMIQISNLKSGFSGGDEPPTASFWTLPTVVLVTHELFSAAILPKRLPALPSHVRIVVAPEIGTHDDQVVSEDLGVLAASITLPNSLKSLVLPSFLRRLDPSMPASVSKRDELLKACTAKKVDIVWHDEECVLSFSKAFWAYAKRLKAEAAAADNNAPATEVEAV
ncbi:hypothetical protein JCM8097_005710 [Rhodosporidiobolus ruineniae]